jgi:hypothetical protein
MKTGFRPIKQKGSQKKKTGKKHNISHTSFISQTCMGQPSHKI